MSMTLCDKSIFKCALPAQYVSDDNIPLKLIIRLNDILNSSFSHTDKRSRLHYKDPLTRAVHVKVRC
jgi:hypothetical protein